MSDVRKLMVWLPNWVGDVVMATPALRALRGHFASAHITYVGRPAALAVLGGCQWADAMMGDESTGKSPLAGMLGLATRLRREHFDLAVLMPNSLRTAAVAWLGGAGALTGYARDGRGFLLRHKLLPKRDLFGQIAPIPMIDYYLGLAGLLGADASDRRMALPVTPADEALAAKELLAAGADASRPLVMLNPGAAFGSSKLWSPAGYAAVADKLIKTRRAQIIINAAPAERPLAAKVGDAMEHRPLINFADRDNTLGLLKGLVQRCSLMITNDTGARHIAAALNVAVVTLFGSTDPRWTTLNFPRERIVRVPVPCSPCQDKLCRQPAGSTYHQCMTAITPEMVLAAAGELLDLPGGAAR